MRYFIITTILFLFSGFFTANAQDANGEVDSIEFSLLTCAPGEEIYSLFGHTAIRYQDPAKGIDKVYNYGIFSFSAPNFIWRFVKGETDYMLADSTYDRFSREYAYYNRAVWEQVLDLKPDEKQHLLQLLETNALPQNRVYRYNFLYDNCSTRARDIIEESIQGKVVYPEADYTRTFRDIIHESSKGYDWSRFGMDFCLGVDADKPITYREEMFAPFYLEDAFNQARIADNTGNERPLVSATSQVVYPSGPGQSGSYFFTPWRTFLLVFILVVALTIRGIKRKKSLWAFDLVLFAAAGLAGCIVTMLSFFSEHPAVSPNYLIFVFHPLHLIAMPFFIYKEIKGRRSIYHTLNAIILTLFILLWPIIPQHFNLAVLPLALCLLVRSLSNLLVGRSVSNVNRKSSNRK